jgi:hypothetical protein
MRILLTILIIAAAAGLGELFLPWWVAAILTVIAGYASQLSTGRAFLAGFCGMALLWLTVILYRDIPNEHILSGRMAQLFKLPSYVLYILVTIVIGGVIGGLAAWSGAHLRRLRPHM